jgi:uncharacterized membrane protein
LALSIGAITLIGQQPTTATQVFVALAQYGFSFLILVNVWRAYSTVMSVLPVETGRAINLNVVLLFLVSIEPYLYYQVITLAGEGWNEVSIAFAIDMALMQLILAYSLHILAGEERKLVPDKLLRKFRINRDLQLLVAGVFILSIAPVFYTTSAFNFSAEGLTRGMPVRGVMWILTLALSLVRGPLGYLAAKISRPSAEKK